MLFRFYRLMKSVRITAPRHNTSGKFIYNQYFIVLHHIILVTEHQIMRTQSKNNIMLNLQVLCIGKVVNVEELLNLLHAIFGQIYILLFLIYNKVSRLLNFFTHNSVHLGELSACLTPL